MTLQIGENFRLAAAGLSLIAVCYGLARFAYGLFVPVFRNTFELDATATGVIAAGSYVAYCVGVIVATTATPRLGARLVAVGAGILATGGTATIAVAPNALVLAIGVLIAGSSTGVASPPLAHAIARSVAPSSRDRTQTIVNAGTGLGVMVSGPIALLAQDQWRIAWLTFAALAAVATVGALVTVPAARDASPAKGIGAPDCLVDRRLPDGARRLPDGALRLLGAAAAMGAASAAAWTFGQDLLVTVGGHTPSFSTFAWIMLGACGLLGAGAGDMAQKLGLGRSWTILMVAMSACMAALAAAPDNPVIAITASGVFGALYIALTGLLLVSSTQVFEGEPSRGVGMVFLLLALGQACAAPLLGKMSDLANLIVVFWSAAAVALVGGLIRPPARQRHG